MFTSARYHEIRAFLDRIPIISTHDHFDGETPRINDPVKFLLSNYYSADYKVALRGMRNRPTGSRSEVFRQVYAKSRFTSYAKCIETVLRDIYGLDASMSDENLAKLGQMLEAKGDDYYDQIIEKCRIKASIVNLKAGAYDVTPFTDLIAGKKLPKAGCYYVIPISPYCEVANYDEIILRSAGLGRTPVCLDDYLEAIDLFVDKCVKAGAIGFKDMTSYRRTIAYQNVTYAAAESVFNHMISRPRDSFANEERAVLCDYLANHFFKLAARYDLPVQIHTGHMAGMYNDIRKANAIHLLDTLELHKDTRFDIFHANWPYMDDVLFIGKNYPNAVLNLCWTQAVDPVFSIEFIKRAIMTMPHAQIFAFGADTRQPEWIYAFLKIAKDNTAQALAELVESNWMTVDEACGVALDMFYNNPNEFYGLGLEEANV